MNAHKLLIIRMASFLFWIILTAFFLNACGDSKSTPSSTMRGSATGKIKSKKLNELSGIVKSRPLRGASPPFASPHTQVWGYRSEPAKRKEEYWGHNDRGDDAEIFRFNSEGKILQKVKLKGVKNVDWEGMTVDSKGNFYIADIGDNKLRRKSYRVYQFTEPKTSAKKIKKINVYKFQYADGEPHNCEAIFAMNDKLYIITKEQTVKQKIFCIDKLEESRTISAREVGKLDIFGRVTDAAYSPERKQLAVLTDKEIAFYHVAEESDLLKPPVQSTHVRFGQCEALCYDENYLVVTNEQGSIWRYTLEVFLKNEWNEE